MAQEINYGLIVLVAMFLIFALPVYFIIQNVAANKRLIVERMGRFSRVCAPGRHVVTPFIERGIAVDLDAELPGWQALTENEIQSRLIKQRYG